MNNLGQGDDGAEHCERVTENSNELSKKNATNAYFVVTNVLTFMDVEYGTIEGRLKRPFYVYLSGIYFQDK